MRVLDPGHFYSLKGLDSKVEGHEEYLLFVKREGPGYPGNIGAHRGTTTQEVLRALIERAQYVDNQIHDDANDRVIENLRRALWHLEERAARRHGRDFAADLIRVAGETGDQIELLPTCEKCNHIGCEGSCHD